MLFLELKTKNPAIRHPVEIFNSSLESGGFKYVNRTWLLKMKKAAGRPKDLLDIENLF